jgi:hypothetical protein
MAPNPAHGQDDSSVPEMKNPRRSHPPEVFDAVFQVAGAIGLEPTTPGFGDRCSTN